MFFLFNVILGIAHEQGRPDRDQFITIDFEAISQSLHFYIAT